MTAEQSQRMAELEAEYAEFLSGAETMEEKKEKCHDVVLTLIYYRNSDQKYWSFCKENFPRIHELYQLYCECLYNPKEDEEALAYLFRDGMTKEEKLKALAAAHWTANNSGYCDAMANRLAAGREDSETDRWQKNSENKYAIDRYYDWLAKQPD